MGDFREVTGQFWASPQITPADVAEAARLGCTMIVNNRPEGESDDQASGQEIEQAAGALGLAYVAIPVTHAGFSAPQIDSMVAALEQAEAQPAGRVLAYCRSGTRSTLLWSLAQARLGRDLGDIATAAAGAGYDVGPIVPLMEMLAANRAG